MVSRRKRANSSVGNKLNNLTDRVTDQQKIQQVSGTQTNAVTNDSIAPNAVNAESIADRAVTARQIGVGAVTSEHLGALTEIVAGGDLTVDAGLDGHLRLDGSRYNFPYEGRDSASGLYTVAFDPEDNAVKILNGTPPAHDGLRFDTTYTDGSTTPGMLSWSSNEMGLEVQMGDGDVTLQIGQEEVVRVVNDEDTTLTNGTVVYVSGSQGQRLKVKRADYSADSTSAAILGVVTHSGGIATNQEGFVTVSGLVHDLSNVRTADGFADGDVLWLASSGGWTATKPSATDTPPHHLIQVGYVVKASNGSAGVVYVHPQNGYELDELHNVAITSPSSGQTIIYDSTNSVWRNSDIPSQNYLLNGDFSIWQRGTSFGATDGYGPDRWFFDKNGTTTEIQETTDVPSGFEYSFKLDCTTTSGSRVYVQQALESAVVKPLRGKTVTFSCYLKMGSNMQALTGDFNLVADYSTSTDGRGSQTTSIGTKTLDKSLYSGWARASYTFVVPSNAVGLRVGIEPPATVTGSLTSTYYVTGAMLEEGSYVTKFRTSTGNPQAELAACQRYYVRFTSEAANEYLPANGVFNSGTAVVFVLHHPVPMRVKPTSVAISGVAGFSVIAANTDGITAFTHVVADGSPYVSRFTATNDTTRTQGYGALFRHATIGSWLEIVAEL